MIKLNNEQMRYDFNDLKNEFVDRKGKTPEDMQIAILLAIANQLKRIGDILESGTGNQIAAGCNCQKPSTKM